MESFRPDETDSSILKENLKNSFQHYYDSLTNKFSFDQKLATFLSQTIFLNVEPSPGVSLQPKKIPKSTFEKSDVFKSSISFLNKALSSINEAIKVISDEEDKNKLTTMGSDIETLIKKYEDKLNDVQHHNFLKKSINSSIDELIEHQSELQNNEDKKWTTFETSSNEFADQISGLIKNKGRIKPFKFSFSQYRPDYKSKILNDVELVSRFASNKVCYDSSFCEEILSNVIKQEAKINVLLDIPNLNKEMMLNWLKDKDETPSEDPVSMLKIKIEEEITNALKPKPVIIKKGEDITASYSAGFNASQYLGILSHDKTNTIYIIDQPEDDISQPSIKETVVKDFKTMSKDKQIILVTHNPQFVVNLDVDNVIYFHDASNGILHIDNGALEYQDQNIDILKIVSENLDGGVDSLRKRWNRYEKAITD